MIAGVDSIEIGDTVCDPAAQEALPRVHVDPPTVRVRFSVNNSPLAGREGKFVTSRQIGERLRREALGNVSIRIEPTESPEIFEVAARGEMQIGVLVEEMRREGYEFTVSRPEIITREVDGRRCEPVEDVVAEVPDSCQGAVLEKLSQRRARIIAMERRGGTSMLTFVVPSRGLFGYRSEFLSDTRGEGILHRTVRGYEPWSGDLPTRTVGAIVATEGGETTAYALWKIQERADLFVGPGLACYEGMIVGANRRAGDMNVHVSRAKKLTNIRAAGKDENVVLTPPRLVAIEWALGWIAEDELLEVTPHEPAPAQARALRQPAQALASGKSGQRRSPLLLRLGLEVPVDRVVLAVAVDAPVAVRVEVGLDLRLDALHRLDADELRAEALDVEAGQRGGLGFLDVHREQVELLHLVVVEQPRQRDRLHLRLHRGDLLIAPHSVLLVRGERAHARLVEGLDRVGVVRHVELVEEAPRSLHLPQHGVVEHGVHRDARPAEVLLQVVGGVVHIGIGGADVEEEAVAAVLEEVADDQLLVELRVELLLGAEDVAARRALLAGRERRDDDEPRARSAQALHCDAPTDGCCASASRLRTSATTSSASRNDAP